MQSLTKMFARKSQTAIYAAFIAAWSVCLVSCSKEAREAPADSSATTARDLPVEVAKPLDEQIADLCKSGDFSRAAKLAGSVKDKNLREKILAQLRPGLSKSLDSALDSCDFKTAVGAADLLSLLSPSAEEKSLSEKFFKRYSALYADKRFGKLVELYSLASPKFLSGVRCDEILQSAYANLGETGKSLELAEKNLKAQPGSAEALDAYVNSKIAAGRAGEALSELRGSFVQKDKYNPFYRQLAARAAAAAGDIDGAAEEYSQAAYYSKGKISIIVECGNFFVRHSKKENYEKMLIPASRINRDSPMETVVAYGYVQALGYTKGSMRNFQLLSNVIENAPLFIDAHFLYADWLLETGVKDDAVQALGLLQSLSLRFKEKNDCVLIKILEISSQNAEFEKIAKDTLKQLESEFSEPGRGNFEDRKKLLELLDSLSKKDWPLSRECEILRAKISEVKRR